MKKVQEFHQPWKPSSCIKVVISCPFFFCALDLDAVETTNRMRRRWLRVWLFWSSFLAEKEKNKFFWFWATQSGSIITGNKMILKKSWRRSPKARKKPTGAHLSNTLRRLTHFQSDRSTCHPNRKDRDFAISGQFGITKNGKYRDLHTHTRTATSDLSEFPSTHTPNTRTHSIDKKLT